MCKSVLDIDVHLERNCVLNEPSIDNLLKITSTVNLNGIQLLNLLKATLM